MASIFTKILQKELPGYFVAEDKEFFAILDVYPLAKGHTLVIPKQEVDYIFDLEPEVLARYMAFSQKVAKAIQSQIECDRIGVAVVGLEVPHAHIHLIPINSVGDMNFSRPKLKLDPTEFEEVQKKIADAFSESGPGSLG